MTVATRSGAPARFATGTTRPGKSVRRTLLAVALVLATGVAAASETDRLIEILIQKGVITAEEAQAVREAAREADAPLAEALDGKAPDPHIDRTGRALGYEPTAALRDEDVQVQVRNFGVESRDGRERFRIRGRMQMDVAHADFGSGIKDVARQGHDFPEYGAILRRVRLGALGVWHDTWEWQAEVDFAENAIDLANVYLAYLFPEGRLAAGYFKEPFGMEYATSSRYISFMERSAASDAYKVNREPGILYETIKPNWYGAVGVFGHGLDFNREVTEGWSVSGRLTFAPHLTDTSFVHIGGGVNHRRNAFDEGADTWEELRLRTREGTRVIDARLIGRDDLVAVKNFTRSNLEFAAGAGPWWAQAEYLRVDLDLDRERLEAGLGGNATDRNSLTQDGFYIQGGYFLTGESKPYRAFSGDYARFVPNRNFVPGQSWGAFEVALRYSVADSLEHTRVGYGQKLEHWTTGLNWYLNPEVAVKANVMYLQGERDVFKDDGWVYGLRLQYLF